MRSVHVRCRVPVPDSQENMYKEFTVDVEGAVSVLNVLEAIALHHDHAVAFYSFCRQGLCGGCVVTMNGKKVLACKTLAPDEMTIDPLPVDSTPGSGP